MLNIEVNNYIMELDQELNVEQLLAIVIDNKKILTIKGHHIHIMVNKSLIRKDAYKSTIIHNGDKVSVVPMLGGG